MGRWASADCPLRHPPPPSPSRRPRADRRRQRRVINGDAGRARGLCTERKNAAGSGTAGCVPASEVDLGAGGTGDTEVAVQVWGTRCSTRAAVTLETCGTQARGLGHVHEWCAQKYHQGVLGPTCAVTMGLCETGCPRTIGCEGGGTVNVTSPPRPLLRSGLCHQGHQPACLLQAPSPLSQPSLKTPDLTQFPAQNPFLGPRGQRDRSRGPERRNSQRPLRDARRPRSLSTPAHLPARGDAALPLPRNASFLGKRASRWPHHRQRKEPYARC